MSEIILGIIIIFIDLSYFFLTGKLKVILFKKRKNLFFRLFYSRVNKIGIPFLLLLNFNYLHFLLQGFGVQTGDVSFYLNLFLFSGFFMKYLNILFIPLFLLNWLKKRMSGANCFCL